MSKLCLFAMLGSVKIQQLQTQREHSELIAGFWFKNYIYPQNHGGQSLLDSAA